MAEPVKIRAALLNNETVSAEFPVTASVDAIKTDLLTRSGHKYQKNRYFLIVDEGDIVLNVEFKKFADADPAVKQMVQDKREILVSFVTVEEAKEIERRRKLGLQISRSRKTLDKPAESAPAQHLSSGGEEKQREEEERKQRDREEQKRREEEARRSQLEEEERRNKEREEEERRRREREEEERKQRELELERQREREREKEEEEWRRREKEREEELKRHAAAAEAEKQASAEALRRAEEKIRELERKLKDADARADDAAAKLAVAEQRAEEQLKSATKRASDAEAKVSELEETLRLRDARIESLQTEIAALRREIDDLNMRLRSASEASAAQKALDETVARTQEELRQLIQQEEEEERKYAERRRKHEDALRRLREEEEEARRAEEAQRRKREEELQQLKAEEAKEEAEEAEWLRQRSSEATSATSTSALATPASHSSGNGASGGFRSPQKSASPQRTKLGPLLVEDKAEIKRELDEVLPGGARSGWVLVNYADKAGSSIAAAGYSDGNVDELKNYLQDDAVQYALVRVSDPPVAKNALIVWLGPKVGTIEKGRKKSHLGEVQKILEPSHLTIYVSNRANLTDEAVRKIAERNSSVATID